MNDVINTQVLRKAREVRGWDQQTLARQSGVDPALISRLERGLQRDLRVSGLVAIARALGIHPEILLVTSESHLNHYLSEELRVVFNDLVVLPLEFQRHVAALLATYINEFPKPQADGWLEDT